MFNDTSVLVGHFVSSPREREKRDRRDSRGDERQGQGRKRNRSEREEIKTFPSTLTCYKNSKPCPAVHQYRLGAPVTRYTTPSPHLTTQLRYYETMSHVKRTCVFEANVDSKGPDKPTRFDSNSSDQPAQLCRLIRAVTVHLKNGYLLKNI